MNSGKEPYYVVISVLALLILFQGSNGQAKGPQPGDVYKEYIVNLKIADNWRVTDPQAGNSGALAFLPNPVLTIAIDDLEGAVRAEALMDIWGGHTGTTGRRVRFNGNDWIDLPEHPSITESPECYNSEFNYITAVPLEYLQEGENTFEGTSGGQTCFNFNWGQWGWYVMLIRIYYGPEKAHPTGMITSHPTGSDIVEMDTIEVNASGTAVIKKVDLLARYNGYDENGDGIYYDWHRNYHSVVLAKHVGTMVSAPYRFVWDTRWIPDQLTGSVSFLARIQDNDGVWYVTDIADSLTLVRPEGVSVKMFTAENVPQKFWVRAGEKKYCNVTIGDLAGATDAILMHRTWNGTDGGAGSGTVPLPLSVNAWNGKVGGVSHNYYLSVVNVPLDAFLEGSNKIGYHSDTEEHGIEILWPGPAILVRYNEYKIVTTASGADGPNIPENTMAGFHVYPVPAVDGIHVELPSCREVPDIYLVNATGRKSAVMHLDNSSVIQTRHLDSGIYLLVIKTDDRILKKKIMVIND